MAMFSKPLTATDCRKRLSIPERVLTSLPEFHGGHAVELRVRYEAKEWPLACTIRKKGYKKPVLSKGWAKFVHENRLIVGDEVTFHKEEEDESGSLFYRVEVKRAEAGPSRALSRSPSASDPGLGEVKKSLTRSCNTYEISAGITSCSPPYKVGFPEDDIFSSSIHGTVGATVNTNKSLFGQPSVDTNDVGDVNVNGENSKSQYAKEESREVKLFGAIIVRVFD
ncbi:hypothetical protein DITRI_Ditri01bG0013600 [Diplodiscus trichospermus]